jgi:excisionase family DNA binding protein
MKKVLTVAQASRRFGTTLDAVYRLIYAGKLPAQKSGRRWLLPEEAIEARLKAKR